MPIILSTAASKSEIIAVIDQWAVLLEQENYSEALDYIEAEPFWKADLLAEVIKAYGDATANRVTLHNNGTALDGAGRLHPHNQRKEVEWDAQERGEGVGCSDEERGHVWYDLNINGLGSDLTATFDLERREDGLHIILQDIHVM